MEAINKWKMVEVCNYNKGNELDCSREDKESQLLDRLRNLNITPNDDEHMGINDREYEELP
jgi:hypothetical protein